MAFSSLLTTVVDFYFSPVAQAKLRVIALTDIPNEPDDAQSMVRFLTYSNQWDVEALITVPGRA